VDVENGIVYYLFNNKVLKFQLPDNSRKKGLDFNTYEQNEYDMSIDVPSVYYDIHLQEEVIVLTSCYNYFVNDSSVAKCLYKIFERENFHNIVDGEFEHDAIALSHLPSYFSDVNANRIVFTNALKNEAVIINVNDIDSPLVVGTSNLLNENIKKVPFNTTITKDVNARELIHNVSNFSKKINRIEGVSFVNDSTIMLVEKKKSISSRGKRTLYFYSLDSHDEKWNLVAKRKFKNKQVSKKYGILQFYYPSGFEIIDGKLYIVEMDIPKELNRKRAIHNFAKNNEEPNFAIYEYKISFLP